MKTCISKITLLAILTAAAIFSAAPAMAQVPTGPDVIFEWEYRTGYPASTVITDMQRCRLGTCTSVDFSEFEITSREGAGPELAVRSVGWHRIREPGAPSDKGARRSQPCP